MVISKKSSKDIEYVQEMVLRYLRPPTPPQPGEVIITQLPNIVTRPAPPLILRQMPARPKSPSPLVIREKTPLVPKPIGMKFITISGKKIPPPPRKVIIEQLPQIPSRPQDVVVERWMPYPKVKRRVIFNKPNQPDPEFAKPKNMIIQWENPQVK